VQGTEDVRKEKPQTVRVPFDSRAVPDPTDPPRLLLTHGRGLHLMRTLMDEVSFEENGTVVRMRKRMKTPIG